MAEKSFQTDSVEVVEHVSLEKSLANQDAHEVYDAVAEKKLVRKIDLHLLPILWCFYLCAFIDRVNIGNARIQGLEEDLNMKGSDFNIALFIFFIPYILFEVPSNMLLKRIRPSVYLPCLIVGWGICTMCQGLTNSYAGLVVCRVLVGVFESGFFPGIVYLISMYYKRTEFQFRLTILFTAATIAGATSGLLAYGIARMDGIAGYGGWRWIFILEGIATVVIGGIGLFFVRDWPATAKFLSEDERKLLDYRITHQTDDFSMNHWNKKTARRVFTDIKIYLGGLMFFGGAVGNLGFSFFAPTILKQLGWTSLHAQAMSIPIWLFVAVVSLTTAIISDKLKHRFWFIIVGCFVSTIGYGILFAMMDVSVGVRYFSLFLVLSGNWIAQPITVGWLSNNLSGHYKRGIGSALQIGIGNLSGIVGANIFLANEAPTYKTGFGVGFATCWLSGIVAVIFLFLIMRENKIRDQGGRDYLLQLPEEERNNLGDDHPNFRYMA